MAEGWDRVEGWGGGMIAHGIAQGRRVSLKQDVEHDAFRAGERRLNAKITLAEQGIGASLARLRRELALIRWMLVGVFAAVSIVPLVMPFVV
jgi:hypothetical protein